MELTAVIKGLEALKEKCKVDLYSDAEYVVDALSNGWATKWRANGWRRNKRDRAINPDLWERLLELCEAHEVTFHWVREHSGNPETERCDQLATEATNHPDLPADEPYEGTSPISIAPETFASRPTGHEASVTRVVQLTRNDLRSTDPDRKINAIFKAVEEKLAELGPDLVQLMRSEKAPTFKSRCAWALGKLNYREAEPSLIAALNDRTEEVRTWSAWALGEIGNTRTETHLRRALDHENMDNVRQAIGGALKKLNYDTTRAHVSKLRKALQPPQTRDPILVALMERLQLLEWKTDYDEIVAVRSEMKSHDPAFFDSYMSWVRQKPEITAALADDRKVFRN